MLRRNDTGQINAINPRQIGLVQTLSRAGEMRALSMHIFLAHAFCHLCDCCLGVCMWVCVCVCKTGSARLNKRIRAHHRLPISACELPWHLISLLGIIHAVYFNRLQVLRNQVCSACNYTIIGSALHFWLFTYVCNIPEMSSKCYQKVRLIVSRNWSKFLMLSKNLTQLHSEIKSFTNFALN